MRNILFVDDDVLALQLMSRVTDMLGYQAIISTSAEKGLAIAANERPDLIIVDMMMDEMSGPDFVRNVRRQPEIADLPVIIFSAGIGHSDEEQARRAGADGFLQKPVGLNDLFHAIQTYAAPS